MSVMHIVVRLMFRILENIASSQMLVYMLALGFHALASSSICFLMLLSMALNKLVTLNKQKVLVQYVLYVHR